jgi:integrase/recombinase XerD
MYLSKAVEGFLLQKSVEGLSSRTLETYQHRLTYLVDFLGDPEVTSITTDDLRRFFHHLRHEYAPTRWGGDQSPITGRTLRNYWVACRSFYTWAKTELGVEDALAPIPAPKANSTQPDPFTKEEVQAIIRAAANIRDQAILTFLLDTGVRASELCSLKVADVDLQTGKVFVQGKGSKERHCYLGRATRRSLWLYLADRENDPDTPLFTTHDGRPLQRHWLRELVANIGSRAGVPNAHPHRFRHTFAVQFLRNGGDIFTLQMLLGHSSLEMVKH